MSFKRIRHKNHRINISVTFLTYQSLFRLFLFVLAICLARKRNCKWSDPLRTKSDQWVTCLVPDRFPHPLCAHAVVSWHHLCKGCYFTWLYSAACNLHPNVTKLFFNDQCIVNENGNFLRFGGGGLYQLCTLANWLNKCGIAIHTLLQGIYAAISWHQLCKGCYFTRLYSAACNLNPNVSKLVFNDQCIVNESRYNFRWIGGLGLYQFCTLSNWLVRLLITNKYVSTYCTKTYHPIRIF